MHPEGWVQYQKSSYKNALLHSERGTKIPTYGRLPAMRKPRQVLQTNLAPSTKGFMFETARRGQIKQKRRPLEGGRRPVSSREDATGISLDWVREDRLAPVPLESPLIPAHLGHLDSPLNPAHLCLPCWESGY